MNEVIAMLLCFTGIGLARERLGQRAYVLMCLVIVVYVVYAYRK